METPIVYSWVYMPRLNLMPKQKIIPSTLSPQTKSKGRSFATMAGSSGIGNTNYTVYNNSAGIMWNISDVNMLNPPNVTDFDYDYQMPNSTLGPGRESWASCKEWTAAQHSLFQTANFFFAAAFLVPSSFKQSVLLVR